MKIIHQNLKSGEVKVKVENLDDLWYLSNVVDPGDLIRGETERKIKIGDSNTENVRIIRKKVHLTVKIEKIEFSKTTNSLRLLGTITDGPEDIGRGSHHTITVEPNSTIKIFKETWLNYQIEKLKEATQLKHADILVVIFDREEAILGMLKARGYEAISTLKGDVQKKGVDEKKNTNFYKEIAKQIEEVVKRQKIQNVIVASPGFWKEYLLKEMPEELKKITVAASCSEISKNSIHEIMKRPELKIVLERDRNAKEEQIVEQLLKAISENQAAYGFKESKEKADMGAISDLLVTDNAIHKYREKEIFKELETLMKTVEQTGGKVYIISSEDSVKKVDALGGIGGIQRWKA